MPALKTSTCSLSSIPPRFTATFKNLTSLTTLAAALSTSCQPNKPKIATIGTKELPTPFDTQPRYRVAVSDRFWGWIYLPIVALAERIAKLFGLLQQGRIGTYLMYSFLTLILTLLAVKR